MAVMQHSLIFGGADSADYGIYIGGEGTFNAPERAVEYKEIPGRNGAFALDLGYYNNIEVKYTAFNYEDDYNTFCNRLRAFRNAIVSKMGYQRLEDTFHPDEYRLAVLSDGLEVKPIMYNTAAQFEIKFNCKPQRYLTSGEEEITVTSGQTITNPTPYPCQPMIETYGYGELTVNGYQIMIVDEEVGYIVLSDGEHFQNGSPIPVPDLSLVDTDDSIVIKDLSLTVRFKCLSEVTSISFTNVPSGFTASSDILPDGKGGELYLSASTVTMTKEDLVSGSFAVQFSHTGGTASPLCSVRLAFDGSRFIPEFKVSSIPIFEFSAGEGVISSMDCVSTASKLGQPTYIDCEIGEVYKMHNGQIMSLNRFVDLGPDLPVLDVGNNEITFDGTYSTVKIIPRWFIL